MCVPVCHSEFTQTGGESWVYLPENYLYFVLFRTSVLAEAYKSSALEGYMRASFMCVCV